MRDPSDEMLFYDIQAKISELVFFGTTFAATQPLSRKEIRFLKTFLTYFTLLSLQNSSLTGRVSLLRFFSPFHMMVIWLSGKSNKRYHATQTFKRNTFMQHDTRICIMFTHTHTHTHTSVHPVMPDDGDDDETNELDCEIKWINNGMESTGLVKSVCTLHSEGNERIVSCCKPFLIRASTPSFSS